MLALKMGQAQRSAKDAASAVVECTEAYEAAPTAHNMLAMQRASKELVEATEELGKQHRKKQLLDDEDVMWFGKEAQGMWCWTMSSTESAWNNQLRREEETTADQPTTGWRAEEVIPVARGGQAASAGPAQADSWTSSNWTYSHWWRSWPGDSWAEHWTSSNSSWSWSGDSWAEQQAADAEPEVTQKSSA